MAKLNQLTARKVATAKDGWHTDRGGLYLRVSDNRKRRRWVFRFTRNGKVTEIGLGAADAVSLAHVREERARFANMRAKGLDPFTERRRGEARRERRKTFAEVAEFVIKRDRGHWGATSLRAWENSLNIDAKRLADLAVAEVSVEDIKATVMPIFERDEHVSARRTLHRIAAVLACAIAHGWRSTANAAAWEVFKQIAPKRPNGVDRRHAALDWREAPVAFAAMRKTDSITARCLEFIALTAAQRTEAREAKWSEIDFDAATWTIPATRMKMRELHVVPLSQQAMEILVELKKLRAGPYVFFGRGPRRPISAGAVWKQSGRITDGKASPHGWRATFRSWCADNGVEREVAESALAHSLGGVEAAYNRAAMVERRRKVMHAWGAFLAGESSATVIPFAGKRP
ncbi:MAG TPA: integrase arm-type DNA-binding domain-containing protein [Roseiarcus sp.]|jgi:integrase